MAKTVNEKIEHFYSGVTTDVTYDCVRTFKGKQLVELYDGHNGFFILGLDVGRGLEEICLDMKQGEKFFAYRLED